MIKIIIDVTRAFGEAVAWLLGIEKKQPAKQSKNAVREPEYDVWKVKILTPRPETQQPVTRTGPKPSTEIDPTAYFYWAGKDLDRWKLLVGATVQHTYYKIGFIENAYRAGERFDKVCLSIFMQRDNLNLVFYASDFTKPSKPFYELLVDSDCSRSFQKSAVPIIIDSVKRKEIQFEIIEPQQKEKSIQAPEDTSLWKHDWNEFAKIIGHYQIKYLYHFTDRSNILSINQHGGLYSWWSCQSNGISILKPGGDETSRKIDRGKELHDYVRLSFNSNSPMLKQAVHEGRIEKPVILTISTEIVYWNSTLFSDVNAAASNAHVGNGMEDFKKIHFEIVTQPYYSDNTKSFYQAEVLVKTFIPIKYILNIKQS